MFLYRSDLPSWSLLLFSVVFLLLLFIPKIFAFFYIIESLGKKIPYKWLHFVPAVLMVANFFPLTLMNAAERTTFSRDLGLHHSVMFTSPHVVVPNFIFFQLRLVITLIYLSYALVSLVQAYRQKIKVNYIWFFAFTLLNALVVVAGTSVLSPYFKVAFQPTYNPPFAVSYLVQGLYLLFLAIFIFALFFPKIIYEKLFLTPLTQKIIASVVPQKTLVLTEVQLESISKKINRYLIKKPYLSPEFSKAQLLVQTQISSHHLSAYLFAQDKTSFSDWKSELQIMESIKMVKEGYLKKHTISSLANDVGFLSRSHFNILFKQYAGCTPKAPAKDL